MQNKSNKNSLYFIYGFTIFIAILYSLGMLSGIIDLIGSPKEINIPVSLNLDLEDEGYLEYEGVAPLAINFSQIKGRLTYKKANPKDAPVAWIEIFFPLMRVAFLLFIIGLSARMMQTTIKEEPLITENANRLKWIGYSFILMGLLKFVRVTTELDFLEHHLVSQYVSIDASYSGYKMGTLVGGLLSTEIPIGLFTIFIAAIFKHGVAIREENELTI